MVVKNKRGLGRGIDALFEDSKETNLSKKINKKLIVIDCFFIAFRFKEVV